MIDDNTCTKKQTKKILRTCTYMCSLSVFVTTVICIHINLITDQCVLPGEDWFDLFFPLANGTEKCKCDKV